MTCLSRLFRKLSVLVALFSLGGLARADFTAIYDFGSVTTSSGLTDPSAVPTAPNLTFGSFTATGTPANPNASARFSFTAWPTGGVNGNDTYSAHTGSLSPTEYYSVTLTPQSGFALNLTALTFTIQRSATGIRTYAVRSNAGGDAFATNLPASISPANTNLSVQGVNVFYYAFDALATAQNGSTVTLTGPAFQNVTTPVTFRFYGWNAEASGGTFSIDNVTFTGNVVAASGPTPPAITTPPASQTVTEGATVHFSVVASGTAPLSYQWRKGTTALANGGIITGATTDTLNLTGVALGDAGNYNVVVTNVASSATSPDAILTVNPILVAPSITTQPSPQAVAPGGTATFTVAASGTAPLAYQWRKGGSPLANSPGHVSGATTPTLTIAGVSAADVDSYDVVVSNAASPAATSNAVALSLLTAVITPTGQISYAGGAYTQNFDTLPATGAASSFTLPGVGPYALTAAPVSASGLGGWSFAKYDGSGTVALFRVDDGGGTSGSTYSYGTGSAGDRALGALASGTTITRFGASLVNNTGRTITQFTLAYTGEEWRRGSAGANTLTFEYGLGATDVNNGPFVAAPALSFTAPLTSGTNGAVDGNNPANRVAISSTVTGLTWAPGQTLVLRWTDVNDGGNDDGLAVDDLAFSTPVGPGDLLPAVAYTNPASGTVNVATTIAPTVTFNEAVNFSTSSFALNGSTTGPHAATVSGGPVSYTLTPTAPFSEAETVTLTVLAAQVTDSATGSLHPAADSVTNFVTFTSGALPIHTLQGSGIASPYAGTSVTVKGIVVANFQGTGQLGGYYIEAPDAQQDSDPATSEGLFIFDTVNSVTVGDAVTVTGTVTEYTSSPNPSTQTELSALTGFSKDSTGNPLPTAVAVSLPFPSTPNYLERFEGMLVTLPQTLTVTDNYDLGSFGEVLLSNGRLSTPTNLVAPGAPAQALEAQNLLNQIILDDGAGPSYPDPTPFLNSADPSLATRRTGSTVAGVTGILDNKFNTYVIEPTAAPTFTDANPRSGSPASTGSLRIAIGNVENLMNGDGAGGGYPTSRGATTLAEHMRQLPKVVAGILGLAPDIMGLTEVENDALNTTPASAATSSYGDKSMIYELVTALNASAPAGTHYAFVDASAVDIVTDVIHCAFIYRTETVEMVGLPAMLNDPSFNNQARNPLAQTFREKATGAKLTVCINHFRAKGSAATGAGNADSGDGQGTNNALRVQEADALTAWLATDPTGSGDPDFLIIGDLNSYAKEDPITHIVNAGFINETERFEGAGGYSYSFNGEFGHLDHALASPSLDPQVFSAATWHVNSDEPTYYDYNVENKSAAQQLVNANTPYRYSDHDPVVIGVSLAAKPVIITQPVPQSVVAGNSATFSVAAMGFPAPTYQWRQNGNPISGATGPSYTISSPLVTNAGNYDVVVTNSAGSVTSDPAALTVTPAAAGVVIGTPTNHVVRVAYDGTPKSPGVTTTPAGLSVTYTFDGSSTMPMLPGTYAVVATVSDPSYTGTTTGTLVLSTTALVRHAPAIAGTLDGSVQLLSGESVTLGGTATITTDLLVPGTPGVAVNGSALLAGTIDGPGSATPMGYSVTLNSNALLRYLVRRIDPLAMPVVTAPPLPTGTRTVTLTAAGQSAGDFATLRNLAVTGSAGLAAVPPGTYGNLISIGNTGFIFGVPGATEPAVYNLQTLGFNAPTGGSTIQIVGPVIINLGSGFSINGTVGTAGHPEWLDLRIAVGGLVLTGNTVFHGNVTAPNGPVTLNNTAVLNGTVVSDKLNLNGTSVLNDPGL